MYGYFGNIAKVDLSTGSIVTETFDEAFARKFLGGNGFVAKLMYDNVPLDADPLGPENGVAIAVGPLTDSPIWGTSRGHLGTIAPQTGLFGDGNYGGDFVQVFVRSAGTGDCRSLCPGIARHVTCVCNINPWRQPP
jgi:aldehyde:ferredoxin oxidoreductase